MKTLRAEALMDSAFFDHAVQEASFFCTAKPAGHPRI
jgi:hypothetical protein